MEIILNHPEKKEIELKKIVVNMYPELEDLIVTPSNEEQKFKSSQYGFDEVTVKKVEGEILEITPSMEKQNYKGLYEEVNVAEIQAKEITITPSTEEQIKEGLFNKVTVEAVAESGGGSDNVFITDKLNQYNPQLDIRQFIKELPNNIDTSGYTSFQSSLSLLNNLEKADMSNWDLSNVTSFQGCFPSSVKEIIFPIINTDKITTFSQMCSGCTALEKVDMSNVITPNLTNVSSMFKQCSALKYLDIRNMTFDKVTGSSDMFAGGLFGRGQVPADCEIIVKSDTEKQWILGIRSDFTNVKTVAELEA